MEFLGSIAYHFTSLQPFIPTYFHLIISALFPIYTGAHASLSPPSSAAKRAKHRKSTDDDHEEEDEEDEVHQKMEGLSPADAIMFPILAGCTLAGLYFLIKWLQDPALLNVILNWYFSVFGVLSVARLLTDAMGVITSYIFPARYAWGGKVWEVKQRQLIAESLHGPSSKRKSPLPGVFSVLDIPPRFNRFLWALRARPSRKLQVRAYVHKIIEANFHLGPHGFASLIISLAAVLYFNLIDKPWWLTNLLGFSFAYSALQIMSPTTFWTGTLILVGLFNYDIYMVFYTPLMVTVATKLEIPAKLLFPRPHGPNDDPAKQALSMLGLGDVVLPGIMIGLALRFDLYLFYLRKQTRGVPEDKAATANEPGHTGSSKSEIVKASWKPATGGWGERFWLGRGQNKEQRHGGSFPKTYFHTSLIGYTTGMLCTLGVMQLYGHAQPALLYLVPGVLGSLWGTALVKGDVKKMWEYSEASEEDLPNEEKEKGKGLQSVFSFARQERIAKRLETHLRDGLEAATAEADAMIGAKKDPALENKKSNAFGRDRKHELVFFSISLPASPSIKSEKEKALTESDSDDEEGTEGRNKTASLESELRLASEGSLTTSNETGGKGGRHRSVTDKDGEPAEKRQKRQ